MPLLARHAQQQLAAYLQDWWHSAAAPLTEASTASPVTQEAFRADLLQIHYLTLLQSCLDAEETRYDQF